MYRVRRSALALDPRPFNAGYVILREAYSQIFCHASWQVITTLESLLTGRSGP
jgi:hypothetical protein